MALRRSNNESSTSAIEREIATLKTRRSELQ
jgi:hypothetical protein